MKISNLTKYLFLVLVIIVSSCSDDGVDGMDGADGLQGPPGQDGNANVQSSDWIDLSFPSVRTAYVEEELAFNMFDEEIRNNAAILVYGKSDSDAVFPIPYTTLGRSYSYFIDDENESLWIIGSTNNDGGIDFSFIKQVRYVIIFPNLQSTSNAMKSYDSVREFYLNEGLDITDYTAVTSWFNLAP